MGPGSILREAWEVIPILFLLLIGGLIALRSGVEKPATNRTWRQVFGNLSEMTLRVMGYVALLLALQYWIGLRPTMGW
jgi:hypothetical protein